jgi:hypothetical protein
LHSEYIDRLENLRRRSMKSCKRDWPRKLIGSRIFIKSHNFIKSLRKKKKGKEVAPPLQERPSRKRDWPGKLIKALRKKKGRQVEIPLQERGEDGV